MFRKNREEKNRNIELLNDFYGKIFVLTIDRNQQRQEIISKELANVDFEFFFGVDGNVLTEEEIYDVYDDSKSRRRNGRSLCRGEIGCALSHKKIYQYQYILKNDHERVLILEDDVTYTGENAVHMNEICRQLPENWDLLYLGYSPLEAMPLSVELKMRTVYKILNLIKGEKDNLTEIANRYTRSFSKNLRRAGTHDFTHAYSVSAKLAEKLIDLNTPVSFTADGLLNDACKDISIKKLISVPEIFRQKDLPSSIWHDNIDQQSVKHELNS